MKWCKILFTRIQDYSRLFKNVHSCSWWLCSANRSISAILVMGLSVFFWWSMMVIYQYGAVLSNLYANSLSRGGAKAVQCEKMATWRWIGVGVRNFLRISWSRSSPLYRAVGSTVLGSLVGGGLLHYCKHHAPTWKFVSHTVHAAAEEDKVM